MLNMVAVKDKLARRRDRKIGRMVLTAARIMRDMDWAAGVRREQMYEYSDDAELRAIVARLYDDPAVPHIQIPRRAVKAWIGE